MQQTTSHLSLGLLQLSIPPSPKSSSLITCNFVKFCHLIQNPSIYLYWEVYLLKFSRSLFPQVVQHLTLYTAVSTPQLYLHVTVTVVHQVTQVNQGSFFSSTFLCRVCTQKQLIGNQVMAPLGPGWDALCQVTQSLCSVISFSIISLQGMYRVVSFTVFVFNSHQLIMVHHFLTGLYSFG